MTHKPYLSQGMGGLFVILCISILLAACSDRSTVVTKIKGEEWDLVVMGDSKSWGVGEQYAAMIEADQKVKVTLTELQRENLPTSGMLDVLRTYDIYRKAVRNAEVIAYVANPFEYTGTGFFEQGKKFECSPEAMASYQADLDTILAEIFALRKGKPTIIRAMDYYSSSNNEWKEWGRFDAYKSCWETINETIHQTAEEHNIPVAEVYAVFNGPTHDEDPMDKGYLRPDGEHPSEAGAKVIAEAFRKLGYDPIIP